MKYNLNKKGCYTDKSFIHWQKNKFTLEFKKEFVYHSSIRITL